MKKILNLLFLQFFFVIAVVEGTPKVQPGIDTLFKKSEYFSLLRGRKIGLITNQTGVNSEGIPTRKILQANAKKYGYIFTALYAPEHGIHGAAYESEKIKDSKEENIPIFSLYGKTMRPTEEMLNDVNMLIFDIQDIGSRSYTYTTTLFYVMEEAAKRKVAVVVLDRPNPINGIVVDGPMLENEWRSSVGYVNVPYCHGMTIGELAKFFNKEYSIGCELTVVPMEGWKREMAFQDTGLIWIPTSPQIPESTTPYYYPMTGILGELQIVSIGVGYTLPFKIVGAPWIDAEVLAKQLNEQNFPGVLFLPFHFRPYHGRFEKENCHGIQIVVTNPKTYLPVATQYLIIGMLKNLYPDQIKEALETAKARKEMFCKVNGTEEAYKIMCEKDHIIWPLRGLHQQAREAFSFQRKKYLLY